MNASATDRRPSPETSSATAERVHAAAGEWVERPDVQTLINLSVSEARRNEIAALVLAGGAWNAALEEVFVDGVTGVGIGEILDRCRKLARPTDPEIIARALDLRDQVSRKLAGNLSPDERAAFEETFRELTEKLGPGATEAASRGLFASSTESLCRGITELIERGTRETIASYAPPVEAVIAASNACAFRLAGSKDPDAPAHVADVLTAFIDGTTWMLGVASDVVARLDGEAPGTVLEGSDGPSVPGEEVPRG